jgi:WD40 repeat protein
MEKPRAQHPTEMFGLRRRCDHGALSAPSRARVSLGNPSTGQQVRLLHDGDNRWLAFRASTPRQALVWDLRAGRAALPVFSDINGVLRFHPTASRVLFPSFVKMSRWRTLDLPGADEVTAHEFHGSNAIEAAFSPDGSSIVTAGGDSRGRVWDARTGAALTPWWTLDGAVSPPQVSPEGLRCFTASAYFLCRLWDVRSGELLG